LQVLGLFPREAVAQLHPTIFQEEVDLILRKLILFFYIRHLFLTLPGSCGLSSWSMQFVVEIKQLLDGNRKLPTLGLQRHATIL
jgi:hypothetical protein